MRALTLVLLTMPWLNACESPAETEGGRPAYTGRAVALHTGRILVVSHEGGLGAVQAVDQAGEERGAFVRYVWWYVPGSDEPFTSPAARTGYAEAREGDPGNPPTLNVGPIALQWSMGGDGIGWVYFGPPHVHSESYELAPTSAVDISGVDPSRLEFYRYDPTFTPERLE